jgi:mono/diheme cytochrome c family protein
MIARVARVLVMGTGLLLSASCAGAQDSAGPVQRGQRLFTEHGCHGCHTVGKIGTPIAPDLSRVGGKYTRDYLARWLRDPAAQRPTAHMPKIQLGESEVDTLAAYLASLR